MASKQTLAFFLVAMLAVASFTVQAAPDCNNPGNCYLCQYCSRRSECSGSNLDQQHKDACSCAYQCDGPCKGFCGYGKRHLLWNAPGMNEIVL
ncbi:g4819 [Coccomyxa viridis]|uniref:G4819 protein n=1 Tax=Coccomyxa viridis TaxID=1274662 RepID=A0ABP1FU75_9CHLO